MRWEDAADRLGLGPAHEAAWADDWPSSERWSTTPPLPTTEALARRVDAVAAPPGAVAALTDAAAWVAEEPAAARLVDHLRWAIAGTGRPRPQPLLAAPPLPAALGEPGRLLPALVVLSLLDEGRARHRDLGVPDDVVDATFTDVGAKLAEHREVHGTWGFADLGWLTWHLAGELWRVGRLQLQASVLWQPLAEPRPAAAPPALAPVVDLHVPADGPLDPDAVDRSLADGAALLARVRPELAEAPRVCWSWLVDPRLAGVAATSGNVVSFQRRFRPLPLAQWWDPRLRLFLYRVPDATPLVDLPRRTSLQRAVGDHLAAGGAWDCALGVLRR